MTDHKKPKDTLFTLLLLQSVSEGHYFIILLPKASKVGGSSTLCLWSRETENRMVVVYTIQHYRLSLAQKRKTYVYFSTHEHLCIENTYAWETFSSLNARYIHVHAMHQIKLLTRPQFLHDFANCFVVDHRACCGLGRPGLRSMPLGLLSHSLILAAASTSDRN